MKHYHFCPSRVYKKSIDIAWADDGRNGEVRSFGTIAGDMNALDKAIRKFRHSDSELRIVYEAGPCGYDIYRHLTSQGFHCDVVAPSMKPQHRGDLIKTDRRDAVTLARLFRVQES